MTTAKARVDARTQRGKLEHMMHFMKAHQVCSMKFFAPRCPLVVSSRSALGVSRMIVAQTLVRALGEESRLYVPNAGRPGMFCHFRGCKGGSQMGLSGSWRGKSNYTAQVTGALLWTRYLIFDRIIITKRTQIGPKSHVLRGGKCHSGRGTVGTGRGRRGYRGSRLRGAEGSNYPRRAREFRVFAGFSALCVFCSSCSAPAP